MMQLPLLNNIVQYDDFLRDYPDIMITLVDLVRYIQQKYSGKISRQEAEIPIATCDRLESDKILKGLYSKYQYDWGRKVKKTYFAKHPEIFQLNFGC